MLVKLTTGLSPSASFRSPVGAPDGASALPWLEQQSIEAANVSNPACAAHARREYDEDDVVDAIL